MVWLMSVLGWLSFRLDCFFLQISMRSVFCLIRIRFLAFVLMLVGPAVWGEEIANSITEFSSTQGADGWYQGYRDYTADGKGDSYDATRDFLVFPEGTWNGTGFDLNPNASGPWTELYAESSHPNGPNSGNEQWVIRRWQADEVTAVTPLAIKPNAQRLQLASAIRVQLPALPNCLMLFWWQAARDCRFPGTKVLAK
jgi:hypothetical protein